MTFWILLVLAVVLSYISLRWRNVLFSLGGAIGWLALWRYNTEYPPTNILVGDTTHEWLNYAFIIMAIAVIYMFFKNRERGYTGYTRSAEEERDFQQIVRTPTSRVENSENMEPGEYRAMIHSKVRKRRR